MLAKLRDVLSGASEADRLKAAIAKLEAEMPGAYQLVASATEALGASALDSATGEPSKAAQDAVRKAQDATAGREAALTAARVRLAALEAAQAAQGEAQRWQEAERLANDLIAAGDALDATLAQASSHWTQLLDLTAQLAAVAPVPLENHVGMGRVTATFDLALDRANLPTRSTYRLLYGDRDPAPGGGAFGVGVLDYVRSRRPLRAAA